MNWIFLATFIWYDPTTATAVGFWVREPHASLEACNLAKAELWGLGKVRGHCIPDGWGKLHGGRSRNAPGSLRRRFHLAAIHPPTEPLLPTEIVPRKK